MTNNIITNLYLFFMYILIISIMKLKFLFILIANILDSLIITYKF